MLTCHLELSSKESKLHTIIECLFVYKNMMLRTQSLLKFELSMLLLNIVISVSSNIVQLLRFFDNFVKNDKVNLHIDLLTICFEHMIVLWVVDYVILNSLLGSLSRHSLAALARCLFINIFKL